MYTITVNDIRNNITCKTFRSAWDRGVREYALELLENLEELVEGGYVEMSAVLNRYELKKALLNGASSWEQYSEGGCALIYNCDIAARLCNPTELTRCKGGERNPNSRETWIDVQARALWQAYRIICRAVRETVKA
jgi:hypothetical protein